MRKDPAQSTYDEILMQTLRRYANRPFLLHPNMNAAQRFTPQISALSGLTQWRRIEKRFWHAVGRTTNIRSYLLQLERVTAGSMNFCVTIILAWLATGRSPATLMLIITSQVVNLLQGQIICLIPNDLRQQNQNGMSQVLESCPAKIISSSHVHQGFAKALLLSWR